MQRCPHRRMLGHYRGDSPHQRTGDACRTVWDQMLCTEYLKPPYPSPVRQQHGCGIRQSSRGHQIKNPLRHCERTLAVVPGPRDHNYSPASTRVGECPSRFHVQIFVGQDRLEVESSSLQPAEPALGTVYSRPVRNQAVHTTAQVLQLEA